MCASECLVCAISRKTLHCCDGLTVASNPACFCGFFPSLPMEEVFWNTFWEPISSAGHGGSESLAAKVVHDGVPTEIVVPSHVWVRCKDPSWIRSIITPNHSLK